VGGTVPGRKRRNGRGSSDLAGAGTRLTAERAAHASAERAARESYGRLLAYLASRCGIDAAEEALADAFTAALEHWPHEGVPRKPEAWLLVTARRRFIDRVRRDRRESELREHLVRAAQDAQSAFESNDEPVDERLGMLFACAHPAIARDMRAPLMLQTVLGLDAARIASAFLIAPATMGQRLVRAKRKIAGANIPLSVPAPEQFPERLDAVLSAIYAAFSEGWGDPAGADPRARGLALEAIWLGRLVLATCPDEPEAAGLLSLMLHAHARRRARRDPNGAYVPLAEQNTDCWDHEMIDEAEQILERTAAQRRAGRFQLEAAIQSAHAVRRACREPDWRCIAVLYNELARITGSPVAALNRAVALARVEGAAQALRALEAVDRELQQYQPYWAARADLLAQAGEIDAALVAYERARGLTIDPSVRVYLSSRAAALGPGR
jgi:RNA polymerase sigma-70 factor (ECF subfamily)